MGIGVKKKSQSSKTTSQSISNDELGLIYSDILERMDTIEKKLDKLLDEK